MLCVQPYGSRARESLKRDTGEWTLKGGSKDFSFLPRACTVYGSQGVRMQSRPFYKGHRCLERESVQDLPSKNKVATEARTAPVMGDMGVVSSNSELFADPNSDRCDDELVQTHWYCLRQGLPCPFDFLKPLQLTCRIWRRYSSCYTKSRPRVLAEVS